YSGVFGTRFESLCAARGYVDLTLGECCGVWHRAIVFDRYLDKMAHNPAQSDHRINETGGSSSEPPVCRYLRNLSSVA
ncbi:hypothetical protein, partial [Bilophila wadsworthia]|uniref:hypothetical protein n=1 Tax=Bilophila wadsworthia TaxID=35833 RepID=UPI00242D5894